MDSKLEAHIDEIFQEVPKTDKMVTMINRIKSKANSKYLQIREKGYSRSVAFNEVDDWLMKAKVIVDEEAGKLTPAEIAAIPSATAASYNDNPDVVVANASLDNGAEVVVEKEFTPPAFVSEPEVAPEVAAETPVSAPVEETPVSDAAAETQKTKNKKSKKNRKEEVEEEDIVVPVRPSGKAGKIIGSICLVGGVAIIVVAALMIVGIIG
ncbi:MAG: hypothetical protein SOV23_05815 [Eubacteriales bacterium]|nr:hypothetical protein [Christensenellaceae bacterium]MDY2751749.1 hypothetical protein [Eubacteriales bacterium]MDY6078398.1 hypothetical protein [Eubacteriales bacterium]